MLSCKKTRRIMKVKIKEKISMHSFPKLLVKMYPNEMPHNVIETLKPNYI